MVLKHRPLLKCTCLSALYPKRNIMPFIRSIVPNDNCRWVFRSGKNTGGGKSFLFPTYIICVLTLLQ